MLWTIKPPQPPGTGPIFGSFAVESIDELLEEPLFLDGIAIRRWSDLGRLRRLGEATPDGTNRRTDPEPDAVTPLP